MLFFALGFIAGVLLMGFAFMALLIFRTPVERTFNQVQSRLSPKGSIIEPEDNELESFIDSLKHE